MQLSQNPVQAVVQYQGKYYPLSKPQLTIGTDQSCDIRIENNPQVLPIHSRVILHAGQIFLQAERGAPTWVNGLLVSQQVLQDQDVIVVGNGQTMLTMLLHGYSTGGNQVAMVNNTPRPVSSQVAQNERELRPISSSGRIPAFVPPSATSLAPAQMQTPPQATGSMATDSTRYLCAAGHLDEQFQDYVMQHVIYEEHRALGESYGVDMLAVVSWCQSGLKRINTRDVILTALFALIVIGYVFVFAIISSALQSSQFVFLSSILGSIARLFSGATIILALVLLPIAFNFEKWLKRRWPNSLPGLITYPVLLIPFGLFGFLIIPLVWLTIFIELILRFYGEPVKRLRRNTFNAQARPEQLDPTLETKLRENFSTGQRNVVTYSGYRPFTGAGYYKSGTSFVIDTSKGAYDPSNLSSSDKRLSPQPFKVSSLYDAVEKDMWALGVKDVLEIEGKLYVHGQYLPEKPDFFNLAVIRPVTSVHPKLVEHYKEHPTEDIRYYQCLRFNFWRGEMIFTAFLRFIQRGKELFIEINYLLLPPVRPEYHWVDEQEITPPLSKIWQLYKRSFDSPVQLWLGAPARLLRGYFYTGQQRRIAKSAINNPAYDYGAFTSLRWRVSDDRYHLFFQQLDEEMYLKIIEKQILETIINFLNAHQIDTSELRERMQWILNNNTTFNGPINNSNVIGNIVGRNSVTPVTRS